MAPMSATYFPSDEIVSRYRTRRAVMGYVRLARPFTLVAPALGMASGGVVAYFAAGRKVDDLVFLRVLLLGTIGFLAGYFPSRRAVAIQPAEALRYE